MRCWPVVAAIAVALTRAAAAQSAPTEPTIVVVFTDATEHGGFHSALLIQLVGQAEIVTLAPLEGASRDDRTAAAARELSARRAALGLWFDRGDDGHTGLYALERGPDRDAHWVGRFTRKSSSTDRELALKVGALLDDVTRRRVARLARVKPVQPPAAVEVRPPPRRRGERAQGAIAGLGHAGGGMPSSQGGVSVAIGVALDRPRWIVSGAAVGSWLAPRTVESDQATLELSEVGAALRVQALARVTPRIAAGVRVDGGVRRIDAAATTTDSLRGEASSTIPTASAGAAVQVTLHRAVAIQIAASARLQFTREQLTVRGQTAAEIDRFDMWAEAGLVFRTP